MVFVIQKTAASCVGAAVCVGVTQALRALAMWITSSAAEAAARCKSTGWYGAGFGNVDFNAVIVKGHLMDGAGLNHAGIVDGGDGVVVKVQLLNGIANASVQTLRNRRFAVASWKMAAPFAKVMSP